MRPPAGSTVRRCLSLALWMAVMMSPSVLAAAGLVAAGAAVMLAPSILAAGRARRRRQTGTAPAGQAAVLGLDPVRRPVTLDDRQLAAHTLLVGASGAGKSTTMLTILAAQIRRGLPVVVIDMKGSPAFAAGLRQAAGAAGRGLRVWTPEGPGRWNPLAHGNPTALKDMLISTERFTEPHYQRAAERYVQIAIGVLQDAHPERPAQLHEVVRVMEPRRLGALLRAVPARRAEPVQDYLAMLTSDQLSAIRGLGTRLALLSESCAGPFLRTDGVGARRSIDLATGLTGGDVILFSLNSSVYGSLAAQLGALVVQDLVSATGRRLESPEPRPPATVAIDEFSALGADNVLALLARGREPGVRLLVGTQEMVDLERAGRGFRDQVLGIVSVKIAHRQDVPASAELIARMAGTERVWEHTEYVRSPLSGAGGARGTRRLVDRYVVDPNEIMALPVGEAVVLTKLPAAGVQRVRVAPPPEAGPATDAPPVLGPACVAPPPTGQPSVARARDSEHERAEKRRSGAQSRPRPTGQQSGRRRVRGGGLGQRPGGPGPER